MKKYLFIGLMAVLATSCEKDPDLSKLDNNFTVYTNYDSKTNFNDFKTTDRTGNEGGVLEG